MLDSSHSLPKLEHIPLLDGSHNAHDWFWAMTQVLKAEGVWGHVKGIDNDPTAVWQASYPPTLTANSTNPQCQASIAWWIRDSYAITIIDCCLNTISKSHLPTGDHVTACMIWAKLKSLYNHIGVHAQFELWDCIAANILQNSLDYMCFVSEFDSCHSHLAAMGFPLSELESIHTLLWQLPNTGSWPQFKHSISHFIQTWLEFDATCDPLAPPPPNTLYSKVVACLEQECLLIQSTTVKNSPGSEYADLTAFMTVKKTSRNPLGIACTNCSLDNHDFNHCWKQGGGAAGQWPGGPNNPNSKITKLMSTLTTSSSVPKADIVTAVLPSTGTTSIAEVSTYPHIGDLSC